MLERSVRFGVDERKERLILRRGFLVFENLKIFKKFFARVDVD